MTTDQRSEPEPRLQRRPDTPQWLRTFARRLYGGLCILCQTARPLHVAHLSDWPDVRSYVAAVIAAPELPRVLEPGDAFWVFHQPGNVVLLCANCHTLYDDRAYPGVTITEILAARDRALATERAANVVREYFCRGFGGSVGSAQQSNVVQRWFPMLDWLRSAYESGHLTPPHRFLLSDVELVDVTQAQVRMEDGLDKSLPRWTGKGFK